MCTFMKRSSILILCWAAAITIAFTTLHKLYSNKSEVSDNSYKDLPPEVSVRITNDSPEMPATLIDSGFCSKSGQYESDFWIDDSEVNFFSESRSSEKFLVKINPRGERVHDITLSLFELDNNSKPYREKTLTCKEQESSSTRDCFFTRDQEDHGVKLAYSGSHNVRATLQFSQFIKDEKGELIHRSTWLL